MHPFLYIDVLGCSGIHQRCRTFGFCCFAGADDHLRSSSSAVGDKPSTVLESDMVEGDDQVGARLPLSNDAGSAVATFEPVTLHMEGKTADLTNWVSCLHSATLIEVSQEHVYRLAAFCEQRDTKTALAEGACLPSNFCLQWEVVCAYHTLSSSKCRFFEVCIEAA